MSTLNIQPSVTRPELPKSANMTTDTNSLKKIERQYRIYLWKRHSSFGIRLFIWINIVLFVSVITSSKSILSVPWILAASIPIFISFALLLKTRQSFITQPYKLLPTKSIACLFISSLLNERTTPFLLSYVIFSSVVVNVWCTLHHNTDLAILHPTVRHPWQINETRVILVASNICLSLYIAAQEILGEHLNPIWPKEKRSLAKFVKTILVANSWGLKTIYTILLWSLILPFAYCWLGIRHSIWQWVDWKLWAPVTRPVFGSFTRLTANTPSPWALSRHLLAVNFITLVLSQIPLKASVAYTTQPIRFQILYDRSPLTPEQYILSALKSNDLYHIHFTVMELLRMASTSQHCKVFFNSISQSSNLTIHLWQELLLKLGLEHSDISSFAPTVVRTVVPETSTTAMTIQRADIFRTPVKPEPKVSLISRLDKPVQVTSIHLNSLLTGLGVSRISTKLTKDAQEHTIEKFRRRHVVGLIIRRTKDLKRNVKDWAGKEWARRAVKVALKDIVLAQNIIKVIVTFAIASVEHDAFGTVQRLLPATLEAIVRLRDATMGLETHLVEQTRQLGAFQEIAKEQLKSELESIIDFYEEAVRQLVATFAENFAVFKFPVTVAHTLREICKS
ncbi:hypothetical protein L204_103491 [Cryptococcus depauperatus]